MKKLVLFFVPCLVALVGCTGGAKTTETVDEAVAVTPAQELRVRLDSIGRHGIAFGQHDATAYGHSWVGIEDSCDVYSVCGDYPAVINWDLGHIELDSARQLDGVPFETIRREVMKQNRRGGINSFSWHLDNPAGGTSWTALSDSTVRKCVTPGDPLNDTIKVWLGRAADFIGSLRDEDGKRIGVIFRPWHEHTGNWFWWGIEQCTKDEYVALWKLTREIFDEKGIDNVLWAYSPDKSNVASHEDYMERYPGDELIDIFGADIYHFNGEKGVEKYVQWIDTLLGAATQEAAKRGKLAALTETGSEQVTMPNWWTDVLLKNIEKYPICYVTIWRNAHDKPNHYYGPFPGHPSVPSFIEFYNSDKTLFARDVESIK